MNNAPAVMAIARSEIGPEYNTPSSPRKRGSMKRVAGKKMTWRTSEIVMDCLIFPWDEKNPATEV